MRIISFAIWFVPPLFCTVFSCFDQCRTVKNFLYAVPCVSFRLTRNTGDKAGVLLARRSTPTYRDLSAARLSDILPGSYLLAEQSPGSSHCKRSRVCCPRYGVLTYNKGKIPLCQGDFSILFTKFSKNFCGTLQLIQGVHRTHKQGDIVVVEDHEQERSV